MYAVTFSQDTIVNNVTYIMTSSEVKAVLARCKFLQIPVLNKEKKELRGVTVYNQVLLIKKLK